MDSRLFYFDVANEVKLVTIYNIQFTILQAYDD